MRCDYGLLDSLDAIATSAIANLSSNPLRDHYVAVLEITPDFVVIGELLSGPERLTREEFLAEWPGAAHIFTHVVKAAH